MNGAKGAVGLWKVANIAKVANSVYIDVVLATLRGLARTRRGRSKQRPYDAPEPAETVEEPGLIKQAGGDVDG